MSKRRRSLNPVDQFRSLTGGKQATAVKEKLPLRNKLILITLTLQILFLGWSMGGMRSWAVVTLFLLSATGFAWLFLPLGKINAIAESPLGPGAYAKQLMRWPFFVCALIFLTYILVQTLNPAWEYTLSEDGKQWWMTRIDSIAFLPSGVRAPFEQMNGWRVWMIFSSAVMLAASLWCGVWRKGHFIYLLWVTVLSTVAMVIVGLIQRFTETEAMLGFIEPVPSQYFGTFTYENHAGAFIGLNLTLAIALAMRAFRMTSTRLGRSGPEFFLLLLAAVLALGLFMTDSRGGMLIAFCCLSTAAVLFVWAVLGNRSLILRSWAGGVLFLVSVVFLFFLQSFLDIDKVKSRLMVVVEDVGQLSEGSLDKLSHSAQQRNMFYEATWEMIQAQLWTGWGAGGFRYHFPAYQQQYPDIHYHDIPRRRRNPETQKMEHVTIRRYFGVAHAHNDTLQFLSELGFIGFGILVLSLFTLAVQGMRWCRQWKAWVWICAIGCLGTVVHSTVDFVFQSPSILCLWLAVLVILVRLKYSAV